MEENTENPKVNGAKMAEPIRDESGKIVSGVLNPNGRPKGSLSFATKFYKVIDKLAKQNDITPEEVEEQLLLVGYKKAKDGEYNFYRDLFDRIYGKSKQSIDINGNLGLDIKDIVTKANQIFDDNK